MALISRSSSRTLGRSPLARTRSAHGAGEILGELLLLAEGGDAPGLTYSDGFKAEQGKTQVLADLAADTTADTVFVPCILDVIPSSVANSDFGMLLPSLADGSFTPEDFAQRMTQAATEATAE